VVFFYRESGTCPDALAWNRRLHGCFVSGCQATASFPAPAHVRMSLAVTLSRAQEGIAAPQVMVEVHLSGGLPCTNIVGLPEAAVREARDRVRVAIQNTAFEYPGRRVTVNLAPAELPKDGGRFDLAIALGILAASGQVPREKLDDCEFLGELALTGALRSVSGVLPALLRARARGRRVLVPYENSAEAALVPDVDVRVARTLAEVCSWLRGAEELSAPIATPSTGGADDGPDLGDVRGQLQARRALEITAVGGHHLLLMGPPGTGKTMLAERLPGIMPPLSESEALETCAVASVSGQAIDLARWRRRPFRAPHHTASAVALVGGGSYPRPGEISLAHNGVLFLDELPEFSRQVLEVLRPDPDFAGGAPVGFPRPVPAGGRDESVPLRFRRRSRPALPVYARSGPALPLAHLRAAAGPHRPVRRSAAGAAGRPGCAAVGEGRGLGHRACAGAGRAPAIADAGGPAQRGDQRARAGARLRAGTGRTALVRGRAGATGPVGPRLSPRLASGAHHRRSRWRRRLAGARASGRGAAI
jgi:energy-coupling factor transporter ATP-binding protein EcfA2